MEPLSPFKFTPIFDIIINTKQKEKVIKREFKKMVEFYKENPDAFLNNLLDSKDSLESKETLTPTEESALDEIYSILNSVLDPEMYFSFSDEMLLNDFTKIYKQIKGKCRKEDITNNVEVGIYYYTIPEEINDDLKIYKDSNITVNSVSVKCLDFLLQYQMLYN
ncbi:MAG: hypothetical protein ABIP51_11355 [Bacteroidia bacterium]